AGIQVVVQMPKKLSGVLDAVRAAPFAEGVQALDESERRGRVARAFDGSRLVQSVVECAVADRDGYDPAAADGPIRLPAALGLVPAPVPAAAREPGIQRRSVRIVLAQRLQALGQEVGALHEGEARQQAAAVVLE